MSTSSSRHTPGEAQPIKTLLKYNRPYWKRYVSGMALGVLFIVISLAMLFIIRDVVRHFSEGTVTLAILLRCFVALMLMNVASGIARYFQRMLMIGASRRMEYDLRNAFFQHIQRLSRTFYHHTPTGDIMARATNDLNYVRDLLGPGIMGTIGMIRLPLTMGMMLYLSARLTFFALIPLPLVTLMAYIFIVLIHRQSSIVQKLFADVTTHVQENLAGARVVRAYGIADREVRAFRGASEKYMRANIILVSLSSFAWPLVGLLIGIILLLVMWQGGKMVIQNELSMEDFTTFLICMVMLSWPLAHLGWVVTLYQRGMVSMRRIDSILKIEPEICDTEEADPDATISQGTIRFDAVSFAYHAPEESEEEAPQVLSDITLDIQAGETLAVVGPTGCGKTTLVNLLAREYEISQGRILIDGRSLAEIPIETLRAGIACVPQDTFVFSESIRENIRLGRPDASDADVLHACEVAQFNEALERMPEGLDTLLGERGINLSGGQKQRLTLARAVLCDPVILILDDALSSVDTHTEERILEGLGKVMAARTSILISHRVSTVRHADRIVVLEEGRIAELGTHDILLSQDGLYAAMYRRQQLEIALEDME